MPQPILEAAAVDVSVGPEVDAVALWSPVHVLARVGVAFGEFFGALSVLEALLELALVLVSVDPLMDPKAFRATHFPLADVRVSSQALPHSGAVLCVCVKTGAIRPN